MAESLSVFSDTSILLDFVLKQDDGSAKTLLSVHPAENVISRNVVNEFSGVKKRREEILKSIYSTQNLDDWEPPRSVRISSNDKRWCADLLAELDSIASRSKIERRLDIEERKINRGWDLLFEDDGWIDLVWSGDVTASLLGHLDFIENKNDKQIIGDAATWANGRTQPFVTSDKDDLLSQKSRIEDCINRHRDCGEIEIITSRKFLE